MIKALSILALVSLVSLQCLRAQETEIIEMRPSKGIGLAEFHVVKLSPNPAGVLVLIPGYNGSPVGLINDVQWRELAEKHRFDVIGCYFKNESAEVHAYQRPAEGSGKLLTDAIRKVYGKEMPMALYGFSAGAQYTSRFIALEPRKVKVWGAYAAGSVDALRAGPKLPPGVVACGEGDSTRHPGLLAFFNEGRGHGYRWMWLSVPGSGHTTTPAALDFIRAYMDEVLSAPSNPPGVWVKLADGTTGSGVTRKSSHGWLPDARLLEKWKAVAGKP